MVDKRVLTKIAYLYYKAGMTQEQIAHKFRISRQYANKLVNSLLDEGIVTITIHDEHDECVTLENLLEKEFCLKQVVVADTSNNDLPPLTLVGIKAGEFLEDFIKNGDKIGVSWGVTLNEIMKNIRPSRKNKCSVVQLVGGVDTKNHSIKPDEITRILAHKLDCDFNILYAPATMNSDTLREIAKEDFYKKSFERISDCNIAVMGIGELSKIATIVTEGYLCEEDLKMLQDSGYVGDICFNPFKIEGDLGTVKLKNQVVGVDFETLKNIPNVIAVAAGAQKADAVYGALKTGCIDILIVDKSIAEELQRKIA